MYNLELDKVLNEIEKSKAKKILVQLPDGLKPRAKEIKEYLEKNTASEILIWAGSCFGACDVPSEAKNLGVDLIIQFGHSAWKQ